MSTFIDIRTVAPLFVKKKLKIGFTKPEGFSAIWFCLTMRQIVALKVAKNNQDSCVAS